MHRLVNEKALGRRADLARQMEGSHGRAGDRDVEIGLVGDDHGIRAAALENAGLQSRATGRADRPSSGNRACERDGVGPLAFDQLPPIQMKSMDS